MEWFACGIPRDANKPSLMSYNDSFVYPRHGGHRCSGGGIKNKKINTGAIKVSGLGRERGKAKQSRASPDDVPKYISRVSLYQERGRKKFCRASQNNFITRTIQKSEYITRRLIG